MPRAPRRPRIGLALGAGSARGWAHIGVIRALEERGVKADVICGTSIGALVGAAYAAGELERLENWALGLRWRSVLGLIDLTWKGGLIRGQRVFDLLRKQSRDREIADLPVPFAAVATELASGREVWLRDGKVLDAVRASVAIPGVFAPAVRDGEVLVDGALVNPVPVSLCRALGADVVIAVDLGWAKGSAAYRRRGEGGEAEMPSILNVFLTSLDIVQTRVARSRLAGEPADALLTPLLPDFATMDFHRAREAIDEGRAAVERMSSMLDQALGG